MRTIIRARSIKECQTIVDRKIKEGWKPLMKVKLDDSQISYSEISYVCVMEKEGDPNKKYSRFNQWIN